MGADGGRALVEAGTGGAVVVCPHAPAVMVVPSKIEANKSLPLAADPVFSRLRFCAFCFGSGHDFSGATTRPKMIRALAPAPVKPARVRIGRFCPAVLVRVRVSGQKKEQGLKPNRVWAFTARLKSCPDTKPNVASVESIAYCADFPVPSVAESSLCLALTIRSSVRC
jgi:hypothetical protein